jgi:hypothetical protein
MRIDRDPEMLLRPRADAVVERHLCDRRAVLGNPKRALNWPSPAPSSRLEDRPMNAEIGFERSAQDLGRSDLEGGMSLGVVLVKGDDPARPLSHERPFED